MTELTHEELKRLLDYDPETGVFRWRVYRGRGAKAGSIAGYRKISGKIIKIKGTEYTGRRLAWFYVHGEMPRNNLFVKNGDCYDDRIDNISMLPDEPKELTQEYLKQCIDYNPETGVFRRKLDAANGSIKAGSVAGCKGTGCNRIYIKGTSYLSRRLAWLYVYGEIPRNNLFVKNGDKFDDRISNIGMLPDKPKELTQEYLKQCIDYNPETGEFKWKITESNNQYGNDAFHVKVYGNNSVTLITEILGKNYTTNRLIVFWMTGYMPSTNRVVMTIDNNALNLKWSNIKVGNHREQQIKKRNIGSLASKGVSFDKQAKKYLAQIKINGKLKKLGRFKTEAEAAAAYMKAARKHYGELANDGYQHAMYEMEYEPVERETVADKLIASMEHAVDIADGKVEPAVVHEVGF